MRPPVLPSGNPGNAALVVGLDRSFNEAAGFTQRKPVARRRVSGRRRLRFNEAAGFTQRKLHAASILSRIMRALQ